MPGLILSVQCFDRATGIPDDAWNILRAYGARANVILPHAEKVFGMQQFTPGVVSNEQLWLVYTEPGTSSIKFVLSCTEGPMGKYPVFIVPTVPISELTTELVEDSMRAYCATLLDRPGFKKERVFSIFSVDRVAESFARIWKTLTGIDSIEEPYYDALLTTCFKVTPATFSSEDAAIERLATKQDAQKIARLCYEFAATSVCLLLSLLK